MHNTWQVSSYGELPLGCRLLDPDKRPKVRRYNLLVKEGEVTFSRRDGVGDGDEEVLSISEIV